ncbi:MAG: spore germination protein, partial [Bacilli bacterium]|nr:spore germination protein [Bacilli bacterium]
ALTAIMSFTISTYEMGNAVRIANFPIMVAAALFGFAGIVIAMLILTIHLCKLESYGVPYLSPLTPLRFKELTDSVLRLPIWLFEKRPKDLRTQKDKRQYQSREWFYD